MLNRLISWQNFLDCSWFLLLLFLLGYFWQQRKRYVQLRRWIMTKGHITQFEWIQEGQQFWPKIEYSYQVFHQDYYNDSLFLDRSDNNPRSKIARQLAYQLAMAYEKEAEINVFYNPNNPPQAVLDIGIPKKIYVILMLLAFLILLHLGVVIVRIFIN